MCVSVTVNKCVCLVCSHQPSQLGTISVTQCPWHHSTWRTVLSSLQAQPHWIMTPRSARAIVFCSPSQISCVWLVRSGVILVRIQTFMLFFCQQLLLSTFSVFQRYTCRMFNISFTKLLRIKMWKIQPGDEQYRGGAIGTSSFPRAFNMCVLNRCPYSAAFKACQPA